MTVDALLTVQVGSEATWGTAATPTAKLMGVIDCTITPTNETELAEEKRGSLAPSYNALLQKKAGEGSIEIYASFEDICYLFDSCFGEATPSGAGPYTRDYAAPLTAAAASVRDMTLVQAYQGAAAGARLKGAVVQKLAIKGESGGALTCEADLIGKEVDDGTLAVLSDRTVEFALGHMVSLYIDTWAGTIGSTAVSATAFSFELEIESGRELTHHLGGLTPTRYSENRWGGTLKLVLELTSTMQTLWTAIAEQTAYEGRQIRIKAQSGTKVIQLDFAGVFTEAPEAYGEEDGVLTIEATLEGMYNSGLGNWFEAQIVNSVSALP